MSSIRLILAVCISCGVLLAQNPDAFASYHQAVENQLSAMLDRQQSARSAVPEAMPVPQSARVLPKNNSEADVKTFANRYWGGRESEFGAAFARLQRIRPALESILEAEGVPKDLVPNWSIEAFRWTRLRISCRHLRRTDRPAEFCSHRRSALPAGR